MDKIMYTTKNFFLEAVREEKSIFGAIPKVGFVVELAALFSPFLFF